VELGQVDKEDFVLTEWMMALELEKRGIVKAVFPILLGEQGSDGKFSQSFFEELRNGKVSWPTATDGSTPASGQLPDVVSAKSLAKARDFLSMLEPPMELTEELTVRAVVDRVLTYQAMLVHFENDSIDSLNGMQLVRVDSTHGRRAQAIARKYIATTCAERILKVVLASQVNDINAVGSPLDLAAGISPHIHCFEEQEPEPEPETPTSPIQPLQVCTEEFIPGQPFFLNQQRLKKVTVQSPSEIVGRATVVKTGQLRRTALPFFVPSKSTVPAAVDGEQAEASALPTLTDLLSKSLTLQGGSLHADVPMRAKLGFVVQCNMIANPDGQGARFKSKTDELLDVGEKFDAAMAINAGVTGEYNPLVSTTACHGKQARLKTHATEAVVDGSPTPLANLDSGLNLAPETVVDVLWWSRDGSSGATLCLTHVACSTCAI
jgi:hypothetical protein